MKFSLASLLAVTLLAALFMSLILQNNRTKGMRRELLMLKYEEQDLQHDAEGIAKLLELCEEPVEAVTFPSETFKVVESKFVEMQEKYGQLEVKDSNRIALRAVPTYNAEGNYSFACRVFVPENQRVELKMFASEKGKRKAIERSQFDFSGTLRHSLLSGQSLVTMNWDKNTDPAILQVAVNGETVLNAKHAGSSFQGVGVQSVNNSQSQLEKHGSRSLIKFSAKCQPVVHDFHIVLNWMAEGEVDE